jgi:hypothetical protein
MRCAAALKLLQSRAGVADSGISPWSVTVRVFDPIAGTESGKLPRGFAANTTWLKSRRLDAERRVLTSVHLRVLTSVHLTVLAPAVAQGPPARAAFATEMEGVAPAKVADRGFPNQRSDRREPAADGPISRSAPQLVMRSLWADQLPAAEEAGLPKTAGSDRRCPSSGIVWHCGHMIVDPNALLRSAQPVGLRRLTGKEKHGR